tara:strand:+ start:93 stop:668 length:576 start_codon:yes stop_codon:yes gene_type:complete
MKKQLLKERFQQLAGIKPLYEKTQGPTSSVDPCYDFAITHSPSVAGLWTPGTIAPGGPASNFGDIDCCEMLSGNMIGPFGDAATQQNLKICNEHWDQVSGNSMSPPQGTYLWAKCCKPGTSTNTDDPCPPSDPNSPFYTMTNFCTSDYCVPTYNHPDCQCCDDKIKPPRDNDRPRKREIPTLYGPDRKPIK